MSVYRLSLKLQNKDVDMYMRLRTSSLFTFLQEASIAHTEELGAGKVKTLDKGLLWVVTMQYAGIDRMPEYGEEIVIETWPGETMHVLFPRYYRVLDEDGKPLINASAIWSLVDKNSRKLVFPDEHKISVKGEITGNETALPTAAALAEWKDQTDFCVPYSYVDLNGHMNNVRYFDLTDDLLGLSAKGFVPSEIKSVYSNEAKYGENITVKWGEKNGWNCIMGESEKRHFVINVKYRQD